MTNTDAISTQTTMPDNWLARANSAAPRTRGDGTFADVIGQDERTIDEKGLFGEEGFSFKTVLDTINPLQHIPIVSTIYREITGDVPSPASQVAGGALFGGVIGFVASLFNVQVEGVTGKDIGAHAVAALNEDKPAETRDATTMAEPAAAPAAPPPSKRLAATPPVIAAAKAAVNVALDPAENRPAAASIAQAGPAPVVDAPMTDDLLLAALTGRDPAAAAAAAQSRMPTGAPSQVAALPGALTPASLRNADAGAARPGAIPIAPPVAGAAPRLVAQAQAPAADPARKAADNPPANTATAPAPAAARPEGTPGNPVRWMPAHPAGSQNFALPDPSRLPPALAQRVSDSYRKNLLSSGAGARETQ